ncbi:MAG TPA: DUF3617 family protein [Acidobacteriaceae bacterium]|jgi:hypothetical protein
MHAKSSCIYLFLLATVVAAAAQDRKPGLYEVTVVTTTVSPSATTYPPRTMQTCLTPEMIEKYGAIVPETPARTCQLANVVKKAGGMTAELVCSGAINGKGTMEVNWTDSEHTRANLHFSGTIHPGQNDIKVEWNAATTSTYKGPDCSAVKSASPPQPPPSIMLPPE